MEVQMCPIFRFTQSPRCFCSIKALQECLNITKTHLCCQVFVKAICKKSLSQSLHLLCREISVCCSLVWLQKIKSDCLLYKWNTSYFIDLMDFNNKTLLDWITFGLLTFSSGSVLSCVGGHLLVLTLHLHLCKHHDHFYNIMYSVKSCQSWKYELETFF